MTGIEDTIAAVSTPPGSGGIAVIRISGGGAIAIADSVFVGSQRLREAVSHKAYLGKIVDHSSRERDAVPVEENVLDQSVVTVFRAPHSYTKEDVVEISCHGGRFLSFRILELILLNGARLAEAGEFTQRAFLNGRLDLAQAEAVADLIRAKTEASLKSAMAQFQGVLSKQVKQMRQDLVDICSLLELELDFAEEDIEFANKEEVEARLRRIISDIEQFLDTYDRCQILREGAKVVILGKPNVGKSSLLNAFLKEERAIVTEVPGTTRDTLEEQLDIRGVFFRVVDTAGVRETRDSIELEGVQRTYRQTSEADIILILLDGSQPLDQEDRMLAEHVRSLRPETNGKAVLVAINKRDLETKLTRQAAAELVRTDEIVEISAKEHLGLKGLEQALVQAALGTEGVSVSEPMVGNLRQKQALERALVALHHALESLGGQLSGEFVALDLREALHSLGEIIGEVTTEDILSNIFSKFCIGK